MKQSAVTWTALKMYQNINKEDAPVRILTDGKVFFDYGPVSMVLMAKKDGKMIPDLCVDSFPVVEKILGELSRDLPFLRLYPGTADAASLGGGQPLSKLGKKMYQAVLAVEEPTLTPMATVAGAVSDTVADWIYERGADLVVANNGGDIAVRMKEDQKIRMGIVSDIGNGKIDEVIEIRGTDGIGGVCTSGLGGRSLTRGIANSVTVFSRRCIQADACATHIANCSYIESERVLTALAGEEDPGSDIADLTIVKAVGNLTEEEIARGLAQVEKETIRQHKKGNLLKLAADIQGRKYRFQI